MRSRLTTGHRRRGGRGQRGGPARRAAAKSGSASAARPARLAGGGQLRGGARGGAGPAVADQRLRRELGADGAIEGRRERRRSSPRRPCRRAREAGDDRAAGRRPRAAPRRGPRPRRGCGRRRRRSAARSASSSSRPGTIERWRRPSATRSGSSSPRKASAAATARAKLRRWKAPGGAAARLRAGVLGRADERAPRSAAVRSASARTSGETRPRTRVVVVAEDGELLGGDLELGLPQPLGVVEADRGEDGDPRGDRVRRVEPATEPGLDTATSTRAAARATKAAAVATSNWVTASPSSSCG